MSISISSIKVLLSSYTYFRYVVWNSDLSRLVQGSYQFVYGESISNVRKSEIFKALNLKQKKKMNSCRTHSWLNYITGSKIFQSSSCYVFR